MAPDLEHELTLSLLLSVADQLDAAERADLLADRELIRDLLALGANPRQEQAAAWIRDADHDH